MWLPGIGVLTGSCVEAGLTLFPAVLELNINQAGLKLMAILPTVF